MAAIDELVAEFARLPGIGRKTAQRLTYYLLKRPPDEIRRLARALEAVAERVHRCQRCGNLTEHEVCEICSSTSRDRDVVCVVEEASDITAIERAAQYRGLYHVLGGRLAPLDGVGPDDLAVAPLLDRIREGTIREVILALNPSIEGEATAVYLHKLIRPLDVRMTRLARGLPVGGDLEYADGVTIAEALAGRRDLAAG